MTDLDAVARISKEELARLKADNARFLEALLTIAELDAADDLTHPGEWDYFTVHELAEVCAWHCEVARDALKGGE